MSATLQWKRYSRRFRSPLRVSGHTWSEREGIIIRLEREDDSVGFGEIAPVPWFPVESVDAAAGYLEMMSDSASVGVNRIPAHLPCTAFALSSAQEKRISKMNAEDLPTAALLPAGEAAIELVKTKLQQGVDTFKWKIGVYEPELEWATVRAIGEALQGKAKLRLDANGGLSLEQLDGWAEILKGLPIDYIEQPLPVGMEGETAELCRGAGLPYAFDESACTLETLKQLSTDFPDAVYVIKPSQAGSIHELTRFLCRHSGLKRVFSWAFETPIGFASVQSFPRQLLSHGASGFGEQEAFEEDVFAGLSENLKIRELEALWRRL